MPKKLAKRAWTRDDVRTLKTLAREKTKTPVIARKLKRTIGATRQQAHKLGVFFVVRVRPALEFLGMTGLHKITSVEPEAGIWIKESRHGYGYGREAVAAVITFAACDLGKRAIIYPAVERNVPSRRLAESLGGKIAGTRLLRKASGVNYPEVVYKIPAPFPN
jgi:RimJ/RimL family protein N-acetyltransferase